VIHIYLSSTSPSLTDYHKAIEQEFRSVRYATILPHEDSPTNTRSPLISRLKILASCDLYIGLFAWDYDAIPLEDNPERKSLAELEYHKAVEMGKPCLIFLSAADRRSRTVLDVSALSHAPKASPQFHDKFRHELAETHPVQYFTTPEHLVSLLGLALLQWEQKQLTHQQTVLDTIARLPHWWRYTLLRCSLRDRSDWGPAAILACEALLNEGREQEALTLADTLTEFADRVQILVTVALYLTRQPEQEERCQHILTKAHVLARGIDDGEQRHNALIAVCAGFAQAQQWERAQATLQIIKEPHAAALACGKLYVAFSRAGQSQRASAVWRQALTEATSIEQPGEQALALYQLGQEVARTDTAHLADEIWKKAETCLETADDHQRLEEIVSMLATARQDLAIQIVNGEPGQGENDDPSNDQALKKTALGLALAIPQPARQVQALRALGAAFARRTRTADALSIWQRAQKTTLLLEDSAERAALLGELFVTLAENNTNYEQDFQILADELQKQAMQALQEIADPHAQSVARWELGGALARAGRWMLAEAFWREAEEKTPDFMYGKDNAVALYKLVVSMAQQRRESKALALAQDIQQDHRDAALFYLSTVLAEAQRWDEAQKTLKDIVDPRTSQRALLELGRWLAAAQQWQAAWNCWKEAADIEWMLAECNESSETLCELGMVLAHGQQEQAAKTIWERAERMAVLISEPAARAEALNRLGTALADGAERVDHETLPFLKRAMALWQEAATAARQVQPAWRAAKLLRTISAALARAQQWEQAEATARLIDGIWADRTEAYRTLVIALIEARQWRRAVDTTHQIKEQRVRANVLCQLAAIFIQEQQWELATATAQMIGAAETRAEVFGELGNAFLAVQQPIRATAAWEEAEQAASAIKFPYYRIRVLYRLGAIYARGQRHEHALTLWEEARRILPMIENVWLRIVALREWGALLIQEIQTHPEVGQEQKAQALELWGQAEQLARFLPMDRDRAIALAELAEELGGAQQYKHAATLWEEAEQTAREIPERQVRADVQRILVTLLLRARQWARAETIAGQIEGIWASRDETLRDLAAQLAAAHQWTRAETAIASIREARLRAEALRELGIAASQSRLGRRADAIWNTAERVAGSIEPAVLRAEALRKLGRALWQERHPEHARAVWWQAEVSAYAIEDSRERLHTLRKLKATLVFAAEHEQLLHLVQRAWFQAETRHAAIQLLPLANSLMEQMPEIALACFKTFAQIEDLLSQREALDPQ
jgi:tetratricopeptide (TPR) repeat protein